MILMLLFILMSKSAVYIITFTVLVLLSCGAGTDDFEDPPTPETCFCDPDGVEYYLNWIKESYPEITELRIIGYSEENRPIYALEISDNPGKTEQEPAILVNACIHGNEQLGCGLVLKLIEHLTVAATAGTDYTEAEIEQASYLIENFKLHFIPAVNPDGLEDGRRYNSNLVDLNRNFGYNWDPEEANNGDAAFDQSESAAVRDDFIAEGYSLSFNFHTATSWDNVGIYAPWDAIANEEDPFITEEEFTETYLPNYELIKQLGEEYEATVLTSGNYLFEDFHYQEGADWYVMYGSMSDWALGERGAVSYTLELYGGQNFTTADSWALEQCFQAHRDATLEMIQTAELGTGGFVENESGTPVADAEITLHYTGGNREFSPIPYPDLKGRTNPEGMFRFLTQSGIYSITVSCTGYETLELDIIADSDGGTSIDAGSTYSNFPVYTLSMP